VRMYSPRKTAVVCALHSHLRTILLVAGGCRAHELHRVWCQSQAIGRIILLTLRHGTEACSPSCNLKPHCRIHNGTRTLLIIGQFNPVPHRHILFLVDPFQWVFYPLMYVWLFQWIKSNKLNRKDYYHYYYYYYYYYC
jgi:hypothetical protein